MGVRGVGVGVCVWGGGGGMMHKIINRFFVMGVGLSPTCLFVCLLLFSRSKYNASTINYFFVFFSLFFFFFTST